MFDHCYLCSSDSRAPLLARRRGWYKHPDGKWYCPDHKGVAEALSGPVHQKARCSKCRKDLATYEGSFSASMSQYEGTVCEKCKKIRCDRCWPSAKGTVCPSCQGNLLPAFARNL